MQATTDFHIERINTVIENIEKHLDNETDLTSIAKVAAYSPFHFHRIFKEKIGETFGEYLERKRLETAARLLMGDYENSLTSLSIDVGYSSLSVFSRAFKRHFNLSPTDFKRKNKNVQNKICRQNSKICKKDFSLEKYLCSINKLKQNLSMDKKINIRELPALQAAAVRHIGKFKNIGEAYQKLMKWANENELVSKESVNITIYHDDPLITPSDKVHQSACLVISQPFLPSGEISKIEIEADKYAVGTFELLPQEFNLGWDTMNLWLEENQLKSKNKNLYEIFHETPETNKNGKFLFDICIPIIEK